MLISLINDIEFESNDNSNWENLNLMNNIIYVDIGVGEYLMSFSINEIEDINQDGIWDILDILLLISFILQNTTPNDIEFHYADLNNDNHLNIFDIILLVNTILE